MDEKPRTMQGEAEGTEDVVLEVFYCILSFNHPSFSTAFPFMGLLDLILANFEQELGIHPGGRSHHLFRRATLMAQNPPNAACEVMLFIFFCPLMLNPDVYTYWRTLNKLPLEHK